MTLSIVSFNIWAVLACIICNMVIGALWYSPILFGNIWLKLVGKKPEDINQKAANNSMMLSIIPAALSIIFLALSQLSKKEWYSDTLTSGILIIMFPLVYTTGLSLLTSEFLEEGSLPIHNLDRKC